MLPVFWLLDAVKLFNILFIYMPMILVPVFGMAALLLLIVFHS